MHVRLGALAGALIVAATALVAAPAAAEDRTCRNQAIGPETVDGNLRVPRNSFCELDGTTVLGNIIVERQSELITTDADIRGNIDGARGSILDFLDSRVDGNVKQIGGRATGVGFTLAARGNLEMVEADYLDLSDSTVNGNFLVKDTRGGSIFCDNDLNGDGEFTGTGRGGLVVIGGQFGCEGNDVSGNVIVNDNRGETEISGNRIKGNLTCEGNRPPPVGGGNQVEGNKEGQCRDL